MFQNWSTKDEIEMSIRTFPRVRDEIENTFSKIEWRDDENGRENLYYLGMIANWYIPVGPTHPCRHKTNYISNPAYQGQIRICMWDVSPTE